MATSCTTVTGLDRVLRCLRTLLANPDGVSVPDLCDALCVSRRTVFRYLEHVRDAGFSLDFDRTNAVYRLASVNASEVTGKWPFDWEESVLLLASLMRIGTTHDLSGTARRIMEQFRPALDATFPEKAGSIWANARLLASGAQSLKEIQKVMYHWAGPDRPDHRQEAS